MIIRAKYVGRCSACHGAISIGDPIDWSRDTRSARHVACSPDAARELAEREAAVQASRAVDADVALPIPDGLTYLPFQRAGIAYMVSRQAALCADDMGLGKTVQAIGVINADPTIRRVLVVCPATLRENWVRECRRFLARPMSIGVATTADWPTTDIVVLNYDVADRLKPQIDAVEWDLAIIDEAHYCKNPDAKRTRAVVGAEARRGKRDASPGIRARRKLALTGTPILNRPAEIWPVLHWLAPDQWPRFWPFAVRYCAAHQTRYGWDVSGSSHLDELQERLRSTIMIRRRKADVLTELPPKRRQVLVVPANGASEAVAREQQTWQRVSDAVALARARLELAKAAADDHDYDDAIRALTAATRVAFEEISAVRHETAMAKVGVVVQHVRDLLEAVPKVVLWAHHRDVIAALAEALGDVGVVTLTGETPMSARATRIDTFQTDSACRVFIGSIMAAGVGITLTAASHVVFAELDWVPANVTQAEDRCHRIGQCESVLVQHIVLSGSLDERMAQMLVAKQDMADRALDRVMMREPVTPVDGATTSTTRQDIVTRADRVTPEIARVAHLAMQRLAGVCDGAVEKDGVGFNKVDTYVGHSLASAAALTPRQTVLALRIATHYRRQLADMMDQIATAWQSLEANHGS